MINCYQDFLNTATAMSEITVKQGVEQMDSFCLISRFCEGTWKKLQVFKDSLQSFG